MPEKMRGLAVLLMRFGVLAAFEAWAVFRPLALPVNLP